jgi:cobalt/nickel transport system permease protein
MLVAVHISDTILTPAWWLGGFVLCAVLAVLGARRIRDEEIPRIGLLTAALFIASSIHIRIGPSTVHLLLNGLAGVLLGWRAALAIPIAVSLQALLLAHGGFTTIGINSCVMMLPALVCGLLFSVFVSRPLFPGSRIKPALALGLVGGGLGAFAVAASIALNFVVLLLGAEGEMYWPALIMVAAHLPVAAIEGITLGFTVDFLARVKPEMLGLPAAAGLTPVAAPQMKTPDQVRPAKPLITSSAVEIPRPAAPPTVPVRD